mmetsp:Transcript_14447/g.48880  ORF Transcript_14447/g.48880 Transcript_14447/m.48880 type:complete len:165 (-) Transcript_14447:63-557(-)
MTYSDCMPPPIQGRKLVVLGDTRDASAISKLAMNADVVIHEATNAWAHNASDAVIEASRHKAAERGHSTHVDAANFARKVRAKRLILTHFTHGLDGSADPKAVAHMDLLADDAAQYSGFTGDVIAAWDGMHMCIKRKKTFDAEGTYTPAPAREEPPAAARSAEA